MLRIECWWVRPDPSQPCCGWRAASHDSSECWGGVGTGADEACRLGSTAVLGPMGSLPFRQRRGSRPQQLRGPEVTKTANRQHGKSGVEEAMELRRRGS